jgi:hypothetical protein
MYIAYSALFPVPAGATRPNLNKTETPDDELLIRYQAYRSICSKYQREIAAVQKYMPGWQPKFQ